MRVVSSEVMPGSASTRGILLGLLLVLCAALTGCVQPFTYQAYEGDALDAEQVAVVRGVQFLRQELLNRYVDGVRFFAVDGEPIENNLDYRAVALQPGEHEITVYFYWDMGSRRGLAPALVNYATGRDALRRNLRFQLRAGEEYLVRAEPVFNDGVEDITTLSHVNFWVETVEGEIVVSRDAGRFRGSTNN